MSTVNTQKASEALGLWEPKRTLTLEAARKHSARIRILRRLLIGLSAFLIAMLVWQFASQGSTPFPEESSDESVRMINPRYSGRTDDNLPYYITAAQAIRTASDADVVELIKPVLHFFREEGAEESLIIADEGTYDDVAKVLNLRTTVDLRTDDGNHCVTSHARIYAITKIVEGDEPIRCEGSFGIVNGNAYEILENYKVFVFKNTMDAILYQDDDALLPEVGNDL